MLQKHDRQLTLDQSALMIQQEVPQVGFGSGSMCRRLIGLRLLGIEGIFTSDHKDVGSVIEDISVKSTSDLLEIARSGRILRVILLTSFADQAKSLLSPFNNVSVISKDEWLANLWTLAFSGASPSIVLKPPLAEALICLSFNSGGTPDSLFKILGVHTELSSLGNDLLYRGYRSLLGTNSTLLQSVDMQKQSKFLTNHFSFRGHIKEIKNYFLKGRFLGIKRGLSNCIIHAKNIPHYRSLNHSEIAFYLGRFKVNGLTTAVKNLCIGLSTSLTSLSVSKVIFVVSGIKKPELDLMIKFYFEELDFNFEVVVLEDRVPVELRGPLEALFLSEDQRPTNVHIRLANEAYKRLFPNGSPKVILNRTGYDPLASFIFAVGRPPNVRAFIWAPNHMLYEWLLRFPKLRWLFAMYHLYTKVIVVSDSSKQDNSRLFSWIGLPSDKVFVLHNFLPPSHSKENVSLSRRFNNFCHEGLKILWVGRFSIEKNPWLIIEALRRLHQEEVKVSLTLLGNGPLYESCKALACSKGEPLPIAFEGERREFDLKFLRNYDVVVNTSLYEGLPNTFYESFVSGVDFFAPTSRWGFEVKKRAPNLVRLYTPSVENLFHSLKEYAASPRLDRDQAQPSIRQPLTEHLNLLRWAISY